MTKKEKKQMKVLGKKQPITNKNLLRLTVRKKTPSEALRCAQFPSLMPGREQLLYKNLLKGFQAP